MESSKAIWDVKKSKFENPWVKWPFGYVEGATRMAKWLYAITLTSSERPNLDSNLPIIEPYFNKNKVLEDEDMIRATWLGHASVLVEIDGFRILCDPVFSDRCPPPFGPKRFRKAPCDVNDLPDIDAILISHNHYDHMDAHTITKLSTKFSNVKWFVPFNDEDNLRSMLAGRHGNIKQMMWWDKNEITKEDKSGFTKKLTIHFTPTQHWSNRGIRDSFKSLWGSWALIGNKHKFWFGGDTGYCKVFKEIGEEFNGFDAAAIPIGAYEPRDLTEFQHCNPEEAIQIHRDIGSKFSFGIHWGTFRLTTEPYMDPKERLDKIAKEEKVYFITIDHGDTLEIKANARLMSGKINDIIQQYNERSESEKYQLNLEDTAMGQGIGDLSEPSRISQSSNIKE